MKVKFSELKHKHRSQVKEWLYEETRDYFLKKYVLPDEKHAAEVIDRVYDRIEESAIEISYEAVSHYYRKKQPGINEAVRKELDFKARRGTETVCFTNMCMVEDGEGNVVALDKKSGGYVGTTFPGGHLEPGETFCGAVIREVYEETGLKIGNPLLCGIYHWTAGGVHNVIFLYRTSEFTGELISSEEGEVYWIPLEEYRRKELAGGMDQVLRILCDGEARECYMHLEDGSYREYLF